MLAAAVPAAAGAAYACTFHSECILGKPCDDGRDLTARLDSLGAEWTLSLPDMAPVRFHDISSGAGQNLHLATAEIDPDADAAALLTIAADGAALLTVQGSFPSLSAVTHIGRCEGME